MGDRTDIIEAEFTGADLEGAAFSCKTYDMQFAFLAPKDDPANGIVKVYCSNSLDAASDGNFGEEGLSISELAEARIGLTDNPCSFRCPGSPQYTCGGPNHYAVYKLIDYTPPSTHPNLASPVQGSYCPVALALAHSESGVRLVCKDPANTADSREDEVLEILLGQQSLLGKKPRSHEILYFSKRELPDACFTVCAIQRDACHAKKQTDCGGKHILCQQTALLTLGQRSAPFEICRSQESLRRDAAIRPAIEQLAVRLDWTVAQTFAFIYGMKQADPLNPLTKQDKNVFERPEDFIDEQFGVSSVQSRAEDGLLVGAVLAWDLFPARNPMRGDESSQTALAEETSGNFPPN
jgi:hypothetical protein